MSYDLQGPIRKHYFGVGVVTLIRKAIRDSLFKGKVWFIWLNAVTISCEAQTKRRAKPVLGSYKAKLRDLNYFTFFCFVPEEMDFFESLVFNVPETVPLVPAIREHVDGDLTTDSKGETLNKITFKRFLEPKIYSIAVNSRHRHVKQWFPDLSSIE